MRKNNKKKLGVIGGMGPKASAYFYNLVVDLTEAKVDQDHIDAIYINHASMPDRTKAILSNQTELLQELLIEDARLLEKMGASFIAITCNTSHLFWENIQSSVSIPVVNMVKETLDYIKEKEERKAKVGLLATDGVVSTKVYEKFLEDDLIEILYPSAQMQKKVMGIIYKGVKSSKMVSFNELAPVLSELKAKGCDYVILGCTELSILRNGEFDSYIVDALDVLAKKVIHMSGAKTREKRY